MTVDLTRALALVDQLGTELRRIQALERSTTPTRPSVRVDCPEHPTYPAGRCLPCENEAAKTAMPTEYLAAKAALASRPRPVDLSAPIGNVPTSLDDEDSDGAA